MEENNEKPRTVSMLLNPKMFNGKHEGRTGPLLLTLFLIFAPAILCSNLLLSLILSIGIKPIIAVILPIYLFYSWRVIAKVLLHEKERVKRFQKEQLQKYETMDNLTTVRRIHNDGCVEYVNGDVCYFIVCKNGNKSDPIARGQGMEKFFMVMSEFQFDIFVLNIVDSTSLSQRYKNIQVYEDKAIANAMVQIIDYNRKYVEDNSLITYTVYRISGKQNDKVRIKRAAESGIKLINKKVYREAILTDYDMTEKLLNRITTTDLNYDSIFLNRYGKGEYYHNEIIGYDIDFSQHKNKSTKTGEVNLPWIPKL